MESDTPPKKEKGTPRRVRISTSLESKFGPPVRQSNERSTRSISESRRRRPSRLSTWSTEAEEVTSGEDNSMFDVLVEAAAQRKISREKKGSRGGQTVYDVLVEATVERMGGQKITVKKTLQHWHCIFKF